MHRGSVMMVRPLTDYTKNAQDASEYLVKAVEEMGSVGKDSPEYGVLRSKIRSLTAKIETYAKLGMRTRISKVGYPLQKGAGKNEALPGTHSSDTLSNRYS